MFDVPDSNGEVSRRRGQDILRRRVEQDVTNLSNSVLSVPPSTHHQ